jgi:biotin carboxyl carrier protein
MVWIPGGEFSMGSDDPRGSICGGPDSMGDARPVHRVYVDGFWMDATEVTNQRFQRFVKAAGYVTIAERKPTKEEFPTAPPENLVAGSTVFTPTLQAVPSWQRPRVVSSLISSFKNIWPDFKESPHGFWIALAMMLVSGARSFYALRFVLGAAEAGFFPGMILYLTYWFPARERAKATARLMRERLRELENGNRPEEIKEAEADLHEAQATVPQLEAEFKRTAELRRNRSATQQDYEMAESKYLAQIQRVERLKFAHKLMQLGPRQERVDVAKAELAQVEADVVKAEWRLGNCTIRAPITGTILKKNAEEGNIVNPIAFNGSFSLCDMADLSDLEVDLNVQERDIALVKVGQKCRVRAEAYHDRVYDGYVDRLMPIADRAKGAVPVRVPGETRTAMACA